MDTISQKSEEVLAVYKNRISSGFTPMPIAIERAENVKIYDVDGKEYTDLAGMFAVVNMGHNNPKIVKAAQDALGKCAMVNTSLMTASYANLGQKLYELFGYDKFIGLTSGAEATDAAVKIAKKWGGLIKKIPHGESWILTASECYHGLTISTHALGSELLQEFGPYNKNVGPVLPDGSVVRYGNAEDLEEALKKYGDKVAAFMVEPIQGSAGIIIPPPGYFKAISDICKRYNVLLIADEVQTGLGRTGYNLSSFKEGVKPDLVCLGKAISGGVFPLSGVMGDDAVMDVIAFGEVGSTMAVTPPATEAALAALDVLVSENLAERSLKLGELFKDYMKSASPPHVKVVEGQGLFIAIGLDSTIQGRRFAGILAKRGVIARTTGSNRMRISPALTISEEDLLAAAEIICQALRDYESIIGAVVYEDNSYYL